MGGWSLEVARMVMYVSFPVAMFHYFNQPEYFEKWVTQKKREIYPPEEKNGKEQLQNLIQQMREKHDQEMFKALDDLDVKAKQHIGN